MTERSPPPGTRIDFSAATLFARKIIIGKKLVMLTSADKGQRATVDNGWLIIDKQWYPAGTP